MSEAAERATLYGSASGGAALLGVTKIGTATTAIGIKTLAFIGIAANPITAAIAGGIVVGAAVYALTELGR